MTKYEDLISKADDCTKKAQKTNDINLAIFYLNAAEGYETKAKNLTFKEAEEQA